MASGKMGGKCKKAERNKKKCTTYKNAGTREKNKARKIAKDAKMKAKVGGKRTIKEHARPGN